MASRQTDNCSTQLRYPILSSHVSWQNQNCYRILAWWKTVSHALAMFIEYAEAALRSCSILAPTLSSWIFNGRRHRGRHSSRNPYKTLIKLLYFTTRESINERSQFMGTYPKQNQMLQLLSPPPMNALKLDTKDQPARRVVGEGSTGDRAKMITNASLKLAFNIDLLRFWPLFPKHLPFSELQSTMGQLQVLVSVATIHFKKWTRDYPLSKNNILQHWIKMLLYQAMHWTGCLTLFTGRQGFTFPFMSIKQRQQRLKSTWCHNRWSTAEAGTISAFKRGQKTSATTKYGFIAVKGICHLEKQNNKKTPTFNLTNEFVACIFPVYKIVGRR